eukprot:2332539-Pyramimonas_sp.AAC.1
MGQEGHELPTDRSGRPRESPRRPGRLPRGSPREPQTTKFFGFPLVFEGFLPSRLFGFPTLPDDPRAPKHRPKTA